MAQDIFGLAATRMRWADQRQEILARNVANADTPGFSPSDAPAFADVLHGVTRNSGAGALARTDVLHLAGTLPDPAARGVAARPPARAPDGNAVQLDRQLTQIADTQGAHQVASSLFVKYEQLFRTAWGRAS